MDKIGTDEDARAPLFDRLIARAELHPIFGQPLAFSTLLSLSTMSPAMITLLPGRQTLAGAVARMLAGLAMCAWIAESSRLIWRARHRYASVRWLHAVRAVVGDDLMAGALARLLPRRTGDRDYAVTRRDMIQQVGLERRQRRETAERERAVRIGGPTR